MPLIKQDQADQTAIPEKNALIWIWLFFVATLFALDLLSKSLIEMNLLPHKSIAFLPHINLIRSHNTGAAFGFLAKYGGWQQALFIALSAIVSLYFFIKLYFCHHKQYGYTLGATLIIAGALGNAYDRIHYGYVVDFIDFHINNWHWFTFNLADVYLTIGCTALLFSEYRNKTSNDKTSDQ